MTRASPRAELGTTMVGGTVNHIVASRHPDFQVGARVQGNAGWQDYARPDGGDPNPHGWVLLPADRRRPAAPRPRILLPA